MVPLFVAIIMRAAVSAQNCFGGIETFEKVAMTDFDDEYSPAGTLLEQPDQALTRDCINLCRQQPGCLSFGLDYTKFKCAAYNVNSIGRQNNLVSTNNTNFFEKVCYRGAPREDYHKVCGVERLWAFERVKNAFLDGFTESALTNIGSKDECAKSCLMESSFICRSADYDYEKRICRLSREDRRTQPQAFRQVFDRGIDYLENQCAAPGPTTCLYNTKRNLGIITMDSLVFAQNVEDCEHKCDKEYTFNCRSFSIEGQRCFLSGDDSVSLFNAVLPSKIGSLYGEKKCVTELCTHGIFTYEKVTGFALRSTITTPIPMPHTNSLGITEACRKECDQSNLSCPAFSLNYQSSRCDKLDRNSQGRSGDFFAREGESYFEKICLRGPEIMSMCQDKYWAFERVIGYELTPLLYERVYHFVQSRRYCEEYCLQEKLFTCKSALYNDVTTECKLSREDRRSKPANYIRNQNSKISYLENQCIRSHSTCPYESTPGAYPTFTDVVESEGINSRESCEQYCNDNRKFLCRSYAFYSSNNECLISGDDRTSAGPLAATTRPGMTYYERICAKSPGDEIFNGTNGPQTSSSINNTNIVTGPTTSIEHTTSFDRKPSSEDSQTISETQSIQPDIPETTYSWKPKTQILQGTQSIQGTHGTKGSQPTTQSSIEFTDEPVFTTPISERPDTFSPRPGIMTTSRPGNKLYNKRHMKYTRKAASSNRTSSSSNALKCGPNGVFKFERVPGFEPIGGFYNLLHVDKNNPGIVNDCAKLCENQNSCRAFVMDYNHRSCFGMFENSSIGKLDLRLSPGKDYFEGFCVSEHLSCSKSWLFDRIIDQATIGARPKHIILYVQKSDCRTRCLEERRFPCLSASYDATLRECRLYDQDRNFGNLRLIFTRGTDYIENQCAIDTSTCRYLSIERDITINTVTRSLRGSSTFYCEQVCNREKEFNCRSYTYIDQTTIPGANYCLLSSDNRGTSQKGSMHFRPRALYAEKDCRGQRKGRVPPTDTTTFPSHQLPLPPVSNDPVKKCSTYDFTYEKAYGYDLRFARRERSRIPPGLGITSQCQEECTKRGPRCRAFVLEYGLSQHCFLLEDSAGENRHTLTKINNLVYFEKVCLREKHCGKLWTFERIIGRKFELNANREHHSIHLRADCQNLCLAEKDFPCRSATYDHEKKICRLYSETRRSKPDSLKSTEEEIDYLENQCVKEPSNCQYKDYTDTFFPFVDRLIHAYSLSECQKQCENERFFNCRSLNYESYSRDCALSSNDMASIGVGQTALLLRRNSLYSEKGSCEQVTVQCNQQDMLLTLNFDTPFFGRVYAKGNPTGCFIVGTGQISLQFAISLGSRCGTRQEALKNFANEVVIQQHAVIMTDSDRTIKVMCSFSAIDQTVTLTSVNKDKPGIDVMSLINAQRRLERPISAVVTNTAPPPSVIMRIVDKNEKNAALVSLGDELTMRIELVNPSSAFALFARNLYARSSNGESLFLIDSNGCPVDSSIFPGLKPDPRDGKTLRATFKAFRFPSTGVVNFEVQIRFCPDRCEPIRCNEGFESYGRRKRQSFGNESEDESNSVNTFTEITSNTNNSNSKSAIFNDGIQRNYHLTNFKNSVNASDNTTNNGNYVQQYGRLPYQSWQTYKNQTKGYLSSPSHNDHLRNYGHSSKQWHTFQSYNHHPHSSQPHEIYSHQYSHHNRAYNSPYNYPNDYTFSQSQQKTQSYSHAYYQTNNENSQSYNDNINYIYHVNYLDHFNNNQNKSQNTSKPINKPINYFQKPPTTYLQNHIKNNQLQEISSSIHTNYQTYDSRSKGNSYNTPFPIMMPSKDKKTFRPPRPLPRPAGVPISPNVVTGSREISRPQEVPLSLAIVVDDKEKDANDKQKWSLQTKPKDKIQSVEMSNISCNTGLSIFYTAIIVTFFHCLLLFGGYFYYQKYVKYINHAKFFTTHSLSTENIAATVNRNPRVTNSNVFFGLPNERAHSSTETLNNIAFRNLYSGSLGTPP